MNSSKPLIDTVTGATLTDSWQPVTSIKYPEPHELPFTCLVLVEARVDDKWSLPMERRVHIGKFNSNVATIGNMFDFDMPKIIAWCPLPEVYAQVIDTTKCACLGTCNSKAECGCAFGQCRQGQIF